MGKKSLLAILLVFAFLFQAVVPVGAAMGNLSTTESKVNIKFYKNDLAEGVDPKTSEKLFDATIPKGSSFLDSNLSVPEKPTRPGYLFIGWSVELHPNAVNDNEPNNQTKHQEDTIYYAIWGKIPEITVIFDKNYANAVDKEIVKNITAGETVGEANIPPNPTREGYVFVGWAKTANATKDEVITNLKDTVIKTRTRFYAVWREAVGVTFDKNYEGAENKETTKQVEKGEALGLNNIPENPSRTNYIFQGWAKTATASEDRDLIDIDVLAREVINAPVTFYAIWLQEKVAVTFDKNYEGAENKKTIKQVSKGEALGAANIPTNPTRNGFLFKGWAKTHNAGKAEVISNLKDEVINGAVTFYAVWEPVATAPEKITLSYQYISGSTSFRELPENVKAKLPKIASTQVDKGTTLTKDKIRPLSELENVQVAVEQKDAQQQIKTVVWKIDRENLEYVYRDLTHNLFVNANYHVADVRDNVDYGIALVPFEQIKVTFYNNHDASDKSFVKQVILDEGASTSVPQAPQRSGFEFLGWSKNAAATVADVPQPKNEDKYNRDTNFYAVWKPNQSSNPPIVEKIKVSFNKNYGEVQDRVILEEEISKGSRISVLPQNPTRHGYTFLGWSKNSNATVADFVQPKISDIYQENTVFYAVWKQQSNSNPPTTKEVKVSFDKNYGEEKDRIIQEEVIAEGTAISALPKNPTREGYTFLGWAKESNLTIADAIQPKIDDLYNEDTTFYAIWKKTETPNTGGGGGGGSIGIPAPNKPQAPQKSENTHKKPKVSEALNTTKRVQYVLGYADGTIKPNAPVTRAELASFYYRLLSDKTRDGVLSDKNTFKDVPKDSWYHNAVFTMSGGKYITGYPDGTFGANRLMTRAEFISVTARFLDKKTSDKTFSDVSAKHWAKDAISTGVYYGLLSGYEDGTFRPDKPITRAEAMAIINRLLDRKLDENSLKQMNYKKWVDNEKGAWYYYDVIEATHDYTQVEKSK